MVKHLPAMWETRVQSPGREYPLEKGMATHSSYSWGFPIANIPIKFWSPIPIHVGRGAASFSLQQAIFEHVFSSVQSLRCVRLFATPWTIAHQASLSISNSQSLFKLMSIKLVMPSNHLILCCPLLLPPSIFPRIRVFSNESVICIRWPKYWSFSFSISPPNEYSGLIFFSIDWFNLLAVQGTLKNCFQHYSSKASILSCSAFFITQLSHPSMTTGKTIALTRQIFVGKVMLTKHFLYLYKYGLLFFFLLFPPILIYHCT